MSIYSKFLQCTYDQLIHDIAIQNLPVLLTVDRVGIVGLDGKVRHAKELFDLSYLRCISNIIIINPNDAYKYQLMLYTGYNYKYGSSIVRCPKRYATNSTFYKRKTIVFITTKQKYNTLLRVSNNYSKF